jgi:hypothetical protein
MDECVDECMDGGFGRLDAVEPQAFAYDVEFGTTGDFR